ncbi:MAG TPA: hypothetical protein VMD28_08540 [Acidimicrobiales bacterium]|nr:hypothetical protein [Acidimicrobiales bacterium]
MAAASAFIALTAGVCLTSCGAAAARVGGGVSSRSTEEVTARHEAGLGSILVDGAGYTLYAYMPDRQGPSRCAGRCAIEWPPLLLPRGASRAIAGQGVRSSLLGTTRRPNGRLQVTYDRWPLYLYEQDSSPGEINGQAESMGLWYVVGADGQIDRGVVPASADD